MAPHEEVRSGVVTSGIRIERKGNTSGVPARPRLLIIITLAERGGAQTYVAHLLPALVERFEVSLAAHGPGPLRQAAAEAGVRFIPLRDVRRPISPWRDVLGLVELVRMCRRERPHIIHANSSKAGFLACLAAFLAGVPIRIFTVHGWANSWHPGRFYLWLERVTGLLATRVVCVSETERAHGLEARTCRNARTVVIRNAVDVRGAEIANLRGGVPTLVAVGRLKAPKDPLTFVRALGRLNGAPFRALVVGDGPDRERIAAAARPLGAAVQLLGERGDVRELLADADVFVLSSRSEGLPISILEAMAAGLPVVASRVGGVVEIVVDAETGYLVPPGDEGALAAAIERLLADSSLRRRLGAAGRARAEALFDLPEFRHAHLELYARELAAHGLPDVSP